VAGKSPVNASEEQRAALRSLAGSRDRGEADRARAVLLTQSGRTSPRIAEAFGVREDTVRLWRGDFARSGVEALAASPAPGLARQPPQLDAGAADRQDRGGRGRHHLEAAAVRSAAGKKFRWGRPRHTLKGRQNADAVDRVGLRLALRKTQAEAGDIALLFAGESEALTHPYLTRAWARRGADPRAGAGASQEDRDDWGAGSPYPLTSRAHQQDEAPRRLHRPA
jgi:hypothetical protein